MVKNIKGDLIYFTFEKFDNTEVVSHCFSTRKGGVSTGAFDSMNLHFRTDKPENIIKNYKIICSAINVDYRNIVFSKQIHNDTIYTVSQEDRGKGLLRNSDIYDADGLITNEKEIVLTTFYADCVPIYFLDPIKRVIAMAHSGWRGTVKEIGAKAVLKMEKDYGCEKKNILAGIGPSIKKCCFEVDYPVVHEFENNMSFSKDFIFKDKEKEGKYKIDLQGIIEKSLILSGISKENIENAHICTKCNHDLFFSHRYMGDERGSMAGLISLK
ncbi:MAG: peptidoglycan editing factor PgeF [Clostridiales bacterium]|nr:peptidoglycan editing factor PgeF [Clostridiales bacterium]